ncbi:hypothetical protein DQ393_31330 [Rhizobium tropici]|uniref:Uncharacterized protein n=2 Tax=Rhizobium TaxID=379 RepID=A0A329Y085_RHITR|nr:hypothetical protein DQ393_31330 [Rhizobium tropici]
MSGEQARAVLMSLTDWMPTPFNISNWSSVISAASFARVIPLSANDRTTHRGSAVSERISEFSVNWPGLRLSPDCIAAIHQLMH